MYPFSIYPALNQDRTITPVNGHLLVEADYLDTRFLALQPEYEAMLRGVGVQPGWTVLDAGCGGGSHVPLLSELVGPCGRVHALDPVPENIAAVEQVRATGRLPSPLDTHLGSGLAIPLPDASVDAVWCANVTQYLGDTELPWMLAEFGRVLRPGGLLAIKEIDGSMFQVHPMPPTLMWRLLDAAQRNGVTQLAGALRTAALPALLRDAGFVDIAVRSTLITRAAPLRPVERACFAEILGMMLRFAHAIPLPAAELVRWRALADTNSPSCVLDHPDLQWCETQTVLIGRVAG